MPFAKRPMKEADPRLDPQNPTQDYRDQAGFPSQDRMGGEASGWPDEAVYWQVGAQITSYFETRRPQLMIGLDSDLQSIIHGRGDGAAQILDDYDRLLAGESRQRTGRQERVNEALIQRLSELNAGQDPDRATEKELWASVWYQEQAMGFASAAEFHRTRLELARLRLIACSDFRANSFFDDQASSILRIAEDECLEAVNRAYSREMMTCSSHCRWAAGEDAASEKRQNDLQSLSLVRSAQTRVDPDGIIQATDNHALFWATVHQLAELRRAWDQTINPPAFADRWLAQLGVRINSWIAEADETRHRSRHHIHIVASIG